MRIAKYIGIILVLSAQPIFSQCIESNCHANMLEKKYIHNPIQKQDCLSCHVENAKKHPERKGNEYGLKKNNGGEMCLACHKTDIKSIGLHTPVKKGECLACHDPHGSKVVSMLSNPTPAVLCANCHKDKIGKKDFVHGPVAVGACNVCHASHGDEAKLLLTSLNINAKCFTCHEIKKTEIESVAFQHKPVVEKCTNCHNPHESNQNFMLKSATPGLCLDCHKEMKPAMADAKNVHSALVTDRSCMNCHNPHGSQFKAVLKNDSYSLCMDCHDKPMQIGTQILPNMKRFIEDSKFVHGPIREKNCSGCHNPHFSKNGSLLKFQYAKSFYAPFEQKNYDLCFQCHSPENVLDAFSTESTNFRNGDVNLHYLHVNQEKGRTCRACHQTHASNNPSHIRDFVPFGGWDLPLNYTKTKTGGSCAPGCHKPKTYKR